MRRQAPLIVGGGPAGAAAAIVLARHGVQPLIVERAPATGDAICGGFVSWTTQARLRALGVDLPGHRVDTVRVFSGRRSASAALPAPGIGLSRRAMDSALLARAVAAGAGLERGVTVRALTQAGAATADGAIIAATDIIVAAGKHALRGEPRVPPRHVVADPVIGLRRRLAGAPALSRQIGSHIELFLFDRGYAGLVLHEDGSANLCLAVRKSRLATHGGKPDGLFDSIAHECPALGDRLGAAGVNDASPDAIAAVPYGWRARGGEAQRWRVGDQCAVIPSLAGEGMGIALASGIAAGEGWLAGQDGAAFQRQFARRVARPMVVAEWLWRAAESVTVARRAVPALATAPRLMALLGKLTRV